MRWREEERGRGERWKGGKERGEGEVWGQRYKEEFVDNGNQVNLINHFRLRSIFPLLKLFRSQTREEGREIQRESSEGLRGEWCEKGEGGE